MKLRSIPFLLILISSVSYAQRKNWAIPDFGVVQYAGSIGFASFGAGYDVFKSKARFSMHYGFVPSIRGGPLNVATLKLLCKPKSYTLSEKMKLNPFDFGVMGSYHYGENFDEQWPAAHARGYYWWHPAMRVHLVMETSVSYKFPKEHRFNSISGYIEFNTNELYLVSYVKNASTLKPWEIIKLGTGIRLHF